MLNLIDLSPSEGEKNVSLTTLIEFAILDNGFGLQASSMFVDVNGSVAIQNLDFKTGFDGAYSDITIDSDKISVVIHSETPFAVGTTVLLNVKIKNNSDLYNSSAYSFKVIPAEPILVQSSPIANEILTSDQMFFLKFTDQVDGINPATANVSINGLKIVIDGEFQSPYAGPESAITKVGNDLSIRIDPEEAIRDGSYIMRYSIEDTIGNKLLGQIKYSVKLVEIILPSIFPQVTFPGVAHGLKGVYNLGTGDSLRVEWYKPISRSYKGDTFALIYYDESRLGVFDAGPKFIAPSSVTEANITGLIPSRTLAWAARSLETYKDSLILTGMVEVDGGIFKIPDSLILEDYIIDGDNTKFIVSSTEGYPASGILIINNSEVVRYISKTDTEFIVPSKFRGLNNTAKGIYISGDTLGLFLSCQDKNTVITTVTPTYADGYLSGRALYGTGLVVTDYTDEDKKFFQGFDFCGYHRAIPQHILEGKNDCGSYLGGEFNGFRGMNLFDRMLDREEVLLDQTGEPVIFLRRIWDGQTCGCMDPRRMHPKIRSCRNCFGTGFEGGYQQFAYKRRADGRIMLSFPETSEDLKLGAQSHLEQQYEPNCWTLPAPAIRDRDMIIRFDYTDDVEYFYEVLDVSKARTLHRNYTRQKLRLKRMDKTDIIYTFPYIFNK